MKIIERIDTFLDEYERNRNWDKKESNGSTNENNKINNVEDKVTLSEASRAKFSEGDKVIVKDTKDKGVIVDVSDFDKILKQYVYDVRINGKIETWNEAALESK